MLFDGFTGNTINRTSLSTDWATPIAISPDGSQVAIGDREGSVTLWSPGSANRQVQIAVPGRKEGHTWPMPFAALVIWAAICWFIWSRRRRIEQLPEMEESS
jgi:hypothetical protein